nr:immunoglobulin light chain junction region [Macaca mulatta]
DYFCMFYLGRGISLF